PVLGPYRYSLLPNQYQFSLGGHRRYNHRAFAPDDCPGTRLEASRAPNFLDDNGEVLVFEASLAGNHFPIPGRIDIPLHAGKVMANASLNKERRFTNRRPKKTAVCKPPLLEKTLRTAKRLQNSFPARDL